MNKKKVDFTKLMLVLVVLVCAVTILTACGEGGSKTGDSFVPVDGSPDPNNAGSGTTDSTSSSTVKMIGSEAFDLLLNAMNASVAQGKIGEKYMNFEFSTYFKLERDFVYKHFFIDFKGAIDVEDPNGSKLQILIRKVENNTETLLMGIYGEGETIYIDLRGASGVGGLGVLKMDDFNLEWLATNMQKLFDELNLGDFMGSWNLGDALGGLLGDLGGIVGGILGETVALTVRKLCGNDSLTATLTTDASGVQHLHIPFTMLNDLVPMAISLVSGLIPADTMGSIYDICEMVFGWDLASVLDNVGNSQTAVDIGIDAVVIDGVFDDMSLYVDIADNRPNMEAEDAANPDIDEEDKYKLEDEENPYGNPITIYLGANNFSLDSVPTFDMPNFTNVQVTDYSLTTINADVVLEINAKTHDYTISGIDSALGGVIAGLIGSALTDENGLGVGLGALPISVDNAYYYLDVKIRAEIDMRDNSKTNGVVEILGSQDKKVRAALYYSGADEALYIDLSGMGSGRYKISTYEKEIVTKTAIKTNSSNIILSDNGYYVECPVCATYQTHVQDEAAANNPHDPATCTRAACRNYRNHYDPTHSSFRQHYQIVESKKTVTSSINLNQIISDALSKAIKESVPSLAMLIEGYVAKSSAVTGSEADAAEYEAILEAIGSGEIVTPVLPNATGTGSDATIGTSIDTMGLILQILSCASIIPAEDSKYSFDQIIISLTGEVVDSIATLIKPGLKLPLTTADVIIDSTDTFGISALIIDLGLGTEEEPDLFELGITLDFFYGRHMDDWEMPNFNDPANPYVDISLFGGGITDLALSLSGELRLQMGQSTWSLSPLQELILGLLIQLQVDAGVDLYFGFTIDANLDLGRISTDTLNAIDARIAITPHPDENTEATIVVYLIGGKLYIDAEWLGLPPVMIDIGAVTAEDFDFVGQLFSKAASDSALSTDSVATEGETPAEEESSIDVLGLVAALITGVKLSSTELEVTLATNLISAIINALGPIEEYVVDAAGDTVYVGNEYVAFDATNDSHYTTAADGGFVKVDNSYAAFDAANAAHYASAVDGAFVQIASAFVAFDATNAEHYIAAADGLYVVVDGAYVAFDATVAAHYVEAADGAFVLVDGAYVAFDAANAAHEGLTRYNTLERYNTLPRFDTVQRYNTLTLYKRNTTMLSLLDLVECITIREGSGIAIEFPDGLNLSELYIDLNLGLIYDNDTPEASDDGTLDLGLGLGHILVGFEATDLTPPNAADYTDVLSDLQVYLAASVTVGIEMTQNEIDIAEVAGAILGDLAVGINVEQDINPGIIVNLEANLDLAHAAAYNQTQIKLELWGRQTGSLIAGVYYTDGLLYADVALLGLEKFYLKLDLIDLIVGLIAGDTEATGGATASAIDINSIDLSSAEVLAILSSKGLQLKVSTGITAVLLSILADALEGEGATEALLTALRNNDNSFDGLNIPELGLEVGLTWDDEDETTGLLQALSVTADIYLMNGEGTAKALAINVAVGGIDIGFKPREIMDTVDLNQFSNIPIISFNDAGGVDVNITNIYLEVSGYVYVDADESDPEYVFTQVGDVLKAFFETDQNGDITNNENSEIFNWLSEIFIRCQVFNHVEKYYGFRIAGNIALDVGALIAGEPFDIKKLLSDSELAIEIYYGMYEANNDPIIGIYLQNGIAYIRLNGTIANDVRLKLNLLNMSLLDGLLADGTEEGALSTASEGYQVIPTNVLDIINGILSELVLNRSEISFGLSENLIAAIIMLVMPDIDPAKLINMIKLDDESSYLRLAMDDGISLNLSLGIEPVSVGLTLGNIRLGFSEGVVIPPSEEQIFESEYTSLKDLSTLSLSLSLGIDLDLYESEVAVGDIVSQFVSDLVFDLGLNFEDDASVGLEINLAANIDLDSVRETEIALEINKVGDIRNELLIGLYIDGTYLYLNCPALDIAPLKVDIGDEMESLLGGVFVTIRDAVGSLEGDGSQATASENVLDEETLDLLVSLSDNYIKLKVTTALIASVLEMLPTFGVDMDANLATSLGGLIDSLGANVEVGYETHEIVIDVAINTDMFSLGIWVGKPYISLSKLDGVLAPVTASPEIYSDFYENNGNVYVELEFAIRYRLFETASDLTPLLDDLLGNTVISGDMTIGSLINGLLVRLAMTNDAAGEIGLKIMANVNVLGLVDFFQNSGENADTLGAILDCLDLTVELKLGKKTGYVSLIDYDAGGDGNEAKYLFVKLDEIGIPAFRIKLDELIGLFGSGSEGASSELSALATDEETPPDATMDMVGKLLGLEGNYVGIGRRGLTVNLAPDLIAVLLVELLGDTFDMVTVDNLVDSIDAGAYYVVENYDIFPEYDAANSQHSGQQQYWKKADGTFVAVVNDNSSSCIEVFVMVDGQEVAFDSANAAHATLEKIYRTYAKIGDAYVAYDAVAHAGMKQYYMTKEGGLLSDAEYAEVTVSNADVSADGKTYVKLTASRYVPYDDGNAAHKAEGVVKYYKTGADVYSAVSVANRDSCVEVFVEVGGKLVPFDKDNAAHATLTKVYKTYVYVGGEYVAYDAENADHAGRKQYYKTKAGTVFSPATLKLVGLVNEKTDDSAFMLASEATDEDKLDSRLYVKLNGTYVLYNEGDRAHAGLDQYYKVRTTAVTIKLDDPKNNGKKSLNIDIALNLGLDIGISWYGYRIGFSPLNLNTQVLGNKDEYNDAGTILSDKLFVSVSGYISLSGLRNEDYSLSPILDAFITDDSAVSSLKDLLLVLSVEQFENKIQFRIKANLTLKDLIEELNLNSLEASIEIFWIKDDGEEEVLIGIYVIDDNAYIDMRNYSRYNNVDKPEMPVVMIVDFVSSLVDIIGGLSSATSTSEGAALSTDSVNATASAEVNSTQLALEVLLGSKGLGVVAYRGLVDALLKALLPDVPLDLGGIFGDISASVMINWEGAKALQDIGLDVAVNIGALQIGIGLGEISVGFNVEKAVVTEKVEQIMSEAINVVDAPFYLGLDLQLIVSVENGVIDIGALLSNLFKGTNISLEIEVPDPDGTQLQLDIALDASVSFDNFNTLEIALELYLDGIQYPSLLIGVYYTQGVFYIDPTGLGIQKLTLTGLDIGAMLEDLLGESLGHQSSASEAVGGDFDPSMAAAKVLLDGNRISVQVATALVQWIFDLDAVKSAVDINQYLPEGLDIGLVLDINYLNEETQMLDIELELNAMIASMFGIGLKIYNIGFGFSGGDLVQINDAYNYVEAVRFNSPVLDEFGNYTYAEVERDEAGNYTEDGGYVRVGDTYLPFEKDNPAHVALRRYNRVTETAIVLEHVTVALEVNLMSYMSGDADGELNMTAMIEPLLGSLLGSIDGLLTQINLPEPILRRVSLRVAADVRLMDLLALFEKGEDGEMLKEPEYVVDDAGAYVLIGGAFVAYDPALHAGQTRYKQISWIQRIINQISASVEIVDYSAQNGEEVLLGVYLEEGDAFLYLQGLGFENVAVSGDFIGKIIDAVSGDSTAAGSALDFNLASENAQASEEEDSTLSTVAMIINGFVDSITVTGKTLMIVIKNTYLGEILNLVVKDADIDIPPFDSGLNAISLNFNRGYYVPVDAATDIELHYAKNFYGKYVYTGVEAVEGDHVNWYYTDTYGKHVKLGDAYVIYDSANAEHAGLAKYSKGFVAYDETNVEHAALTRYNMKYVAYDENNAAHKALIRYDLFISNDGVNFTPYDVTNAAHNAALAGENPDTRAELYFWVERNGIVEIDISFYTSLLGVYIPFPSIGATKLNIEMPNAVYTPIEDIKGVSLELRGSFGGHGLLESGITTTLGEVLGGIVGDLPAVLNISQMNLEIDFIISAYLGFDYSFNPAPGEAPFSFTDIDLSIKLLRINESNNYTVQGNIVYTSSTDTIYVDLAYFGLPKVAVGGLDLPGLLNGLIAGDDSAAAAVSTNGSEEGALAVAESDAGASAALEATENIFSTAAQLLVVMEKNSLALGISYGLIVGIINAIPGAEGIAQYIPSLGVELHIDTNPFLLGLLIQLQDDEANGVIDIYLTLKGFDWDEKGPEGEKNSGSDLHFFSEGADEYMGDYVDIDPNEFTTIIVLNLDANADLGEETVEVVVENLSVSTTIKLEFNAFVAENRDWAKYFGAIFNLTEDELNVWLAVLGAEGEASQTILSLGLEVNVNLQGLLSKPMTLAGTEARITLSFVSDFLSKEIYDGGVIPQLIITLIGDNGSGKSDIYLELSNYRDSTGDNTFRYKTTIGLAELLGLGSSMENALATEEVNKGLLGDAYDIVAGIIGSLTLSDQGIEIGINENLISTIFDLLLAENPNFQSGMAMPKVSGGLSILIPSWKIELKLTFDPEDNPMSIALAVENLKIGTNKLGDDQVVGGASVTSLAPVGAAAYRNLMDLQLDLRLDGYLTYKLLAPTETLPALDLSPIFGLITSDSTGLPLLQNPLIQMSAANDLEMYHIIDTHAYVDLNNFNNMKVQIEIWKNLEDKESGMEPDIGVYLDGYDVYVNLSALGIPRIKITGINLGKIVNDAIGGALGGILSESATASDERIEMTDESQWAGKILNSLPTAYMSLVFAPEKFAIALNLAMVDEIYKAIVRSKGTTVEDGEVFIPNLGDVAIVMDSTTGLPLPSINIKLGAGFVAAFGLSEVEVNMSDFSANKVYDSATMHTDPDDNGKPTLYSGFMDNFYANYAPEYIGAYDLATGQIGLDKLAVGLNIDFELKTGDYTANASDERYKNSFQYYLSCLLYSLLGGDVDPDEIDAAIAQFAVTAGANQNMKYTLTVRAVVDVGSLITSSGFNIAGILDSELSVELRIASYENKKVLGLYKMAGDDAVYADLDGLGLPKVKLFGLGSLIKGLESGSSAATDGSAAAIGTENATASAANTSAEVAFAELIVDEGLIRIVIEPEVIWQILAYAGFEVVDNSGYGSFKGVVTYSDKEVTDANGVVSTVKVEKIIPLPNVQSVSLSINILDKLESIDIDIQADSLGTGLKLSINNFTITDETDGFIPDTLMPVDDNEYGALHLSDGNGLSVGNIVGSLLGGININLGITLNKNVGNSAGGDGKTNAQLRIVTTTNETHSWGKDGANGYLTGSNKLMVQLALTNNDTNYASIYLYNKAIYGDISGVLGGEGGLGNIILSLVSTFELMRFADLDIAGMLAEEETTSTDAIATASADESPLSGFFDGLFDGIKIDQIIKGIQIDWWNSYPSNVYVDADKKAWNTTARSNRFSSIRVYLDPTFVNNLMATINMLVIALLQADVDADFNFSGGLTTEQKATFRGLTADQKVDYLRGGAVAGLPNLEASQIPDYAYEWVANKLLSALLGMNLGGILGFVPSIRSNLESIIACLLPFPMIDPATQTVYAEILLDKGTENLNSEMNLISEIGIYIGNTATKDLKSTPRADMPTNSMALVINNGGIDVKSAQSWAWYNDGERQNGEVMLSEDYTIGDPFNAWEISASALSDGSSLPQRVRVNFTDGTNTQSAGGAKTDMDELGGTAVVWDTTHVDLTPGSTTGYLVGYALNTVVATVPVKVSNMTGYRSLYGYLDESGNLIRATKLTIDKTGLAANSVRALPNTIVILLNNGNFQVLNTEGMAQYYKDDNGSQVIDATTGAYVNYDAGNTAHAGLQRYTLRVIDGVTTKSSTTYGTLSWIDDADDYEANGDGEMPEFKFWYQVNGSARITKSLQLVYKERVVESISLPATWDVYEKDDNGNFVYDAATDSYVAYNSTIHTGTARYSFVQTVNDKFNFVKGGAQLDVLNLKWYNYDVAASLRELKTVDVRYTTGDRAKLSVEWDLSLLERNYDPDEPYNGLNSKITAIVGKAEGIEQEIDIDVSLEAKTVTRVSKESGVTPSFSYNPYDPYESASITLTDGSKLKLDMNLGGVAATGTLVDVELLLPQVVESGATEGQINRSVLSYNGGQSFIATVMIGAIRVGTPAAEGAYVYDAATTSYLPYDAATHGTAKRYNVNLVGGQTKSVLVNVEKKVAQSANLQIADVWGLATLMGNTVESTVSVPLDMIASTDGFGYKTAQVSFGDGTVSNIKVKSVTLAAGDVTNNGGARTATIVVTDTNGFNEQTLSAVLTIPRKTITNVYAIEGDGSTLYVKYSMGGKGIYQATYTAPAAIVDALSLVTAGNSLNLTADAFMIGTQTVDSITVLADADAVAGASEETLDAALPQLEAEECVAYASEGEADAWYNNIVDVVDARYRSIIVDPVVDSEISYPSVLDIYYYDPADDTVKTMTVNARFVTLDAFADGIPELGYTTVDIVSARDSSVIYHNRMYHGAVYPDARVEFSSQINPAETALWGVSVEVLNRVITNDNIAPQVTILNPYTFCADINSSRLSNELPTVVNVSYESGEIRSYPLVWSNLDTDIVAATGKSYAATVTYGTGMGKYMQDVAIFVRAYQATAEKLSSVQQLLNDKEFFAYSFQSDHSDDPLYVKNYPSSVTVNIGGVDTLLYINWDLSKLAYDYNGGVKDVIAYVGNERFGWQEVTFKINVKACKIKNIDIAFPTAFSNYATGLDILACGTSAPSVNTANVVFEDENGNVVYTSTNEKITWDMSGVAKGLSSKGGTFNVRAIIRYREYAGTQGKDFTFVYRAKTIASVKTTANGDIFSTTTPIDPYGEDNTITPPSEVMVNYTDGSSQNYSTKNSEYILTWNKSNYRTYYNSPSCYIIATFTHAGVSESYTFYFTIDNYYVKTITLEGVDTAGVSTSTTYYVKDGIAYSDPACTTRGVYTIDPFSSANNHVVNNSVNVVLDRWVYDRSLASTWASSNGTMVIGSNNAFTWTPSAGTVMAGTWTVSGNKISYVEDTGVFVNPEDETLGTIKNTYTATFVTGSNSLVVYKQVGDGAVEEWQTFARKARKTDETDSKINYTATVTMQGNFKVTAKGGTGYSASIKLGKHETVKIDVTVLDRSLYIGGEMATEELVRTAIGTITNGRNDYGLDDTIQLPATISGVSYNGAGITTSGTHNIYWEIVTYSYTTDMMQSKNVHTYTDCDFLGSRSATTRPVTYTVQSLKSTTIKTKMNSAQQEVNGEARKLDTSYVGFKLTAYVGRCNDSNGNIVQAEQFKVVYNIGRGGFTQKTVNFSEFSGAWRSNDANYNYIVFNADAAQSGQIITSTSPTEVTWTYTEETKALTLGGKAVTINSNGTLTYEGVNYVRYNFDVGFIN